MDSKQLPARPSLEQYKKQAKELLKAYKSGGLEAIQRIKKNHPRLDKLPDSGIPPAGLNAKFALADAQLVIARENGFPNWTEFKEYVLFRNAVEALDAGDIQTLQALLDKYPFLIRYRCHKGKWYEEGYFAGATLLNHIAGNPVRCPIPGNIVEITRLLLSRGAHDEPPRPKYTIGLLLTSRQASEAGVALPLIDLLIEAGKLELDLTAPDILNGPLGNQAPATAEALIQRGARMELRHAAALGRLDLVKRFFAGSDGVMADASLIPLSAEPAEAKVQTEQAFIEACMCGRTSVAEFLLEQRVDPSSQVNSGQTGLHYAAHAGHLETVRMLLERKVPLEVKNMYDGTVLGQALWSAFNEPRPDHLPIIEALIAAGAKIEPDWQKWIDELRQRQNAQPDESGTAIQPLPPNTNLEQYGRLAEDLFKVYSSADVEALQRLNDAYSSSFTVDRLRTNVQRRLGIPADSEASTSEFTLADAQRFIASLYGFGSWAKFAESLKPPTDSAGSGSPSPRSTPPFYKIDRKNNTIEPRPPLSAKDWDTIFGVMKEQQITGLNGGGGLTDAVMKRLADLGHVTRLNLEGAKHLTDDGLLQLARMPQLRELDLSGWESNVTDRGLEVLRHLSELRHFKMCWPQRVTDAGAANLVFCDHLEEVNLMGTPTGDGAIKALAGKRNLRRFKTGKLVTDAGLPLLHQFPVFKTWQGGEIKYGLMAFEAEPTDLLLDGPFTDKGLASLAGLEGLFGLGFFWHISALTAEGLKPLAQLPNLGFLGCQGELCNDEAMRHIAAIPKLRMLMGQGTVASDDGFAALSRSQSIEYIWGRECLNLGGRGFAALATMPALKGLAVSCKNVDDAALSTLPKFPALRGLMPMDVSDDGFRHVGRCEQLENLWCMYCRDTGDAATEHLAGLSRLKTYYAGATKITDRSLEILSRMPSLEVLEFWECASITNTGMALLAKLPRLREISVGGSPDVTREGMGLFPTTVRTSY